MRTEQKILALIFKKQNSELKFLALRNNPEDPKFGGDFWYVVTGSAEIDESLEQAVKREINEETGIEEIWQIIDVDTIYDYDDPDKDIHYYEHAFLVEVKDEVKHLNEENIEYKWLNEKDFVKIIRWYGNDLIKFIQIAQKQ